MMSITSETGIASANVLCLEIMTSGIPMAAVSFITLVVIYVKAKEKAPISNLFR